MSSKKFKKCSKHGWLPKSDFYSSTSKRKGRKKIATYYYCKLCTKEYCVSKRGKDNRNRLRREWGKNHPEEERMMSRSKYSKKPQQYRAAQKRERQKLRLEVLSHYSKGTPTCDCCGDTNYEFLALDHIKGGGNKHRKSLGGSSAYKVYRFARQNNYPDMFRVLCHNCNFSYGHYGYCPHQKDKENVGKDQEGQM